MEAPPDAPPWLVDHLAAMRAVADGHVSHSELIHVPWPEDSELWAPYADTPPGFQPVWYRLPRQGPVPAKRHGRNPTKGDGWTLDTIGYVTP